MSDNSYVQRRSEIETYFDRTASDAWTKLTSNAPVSRIRQTVRAGRDEMRNTLLSWLPDNLEGCRVLDAGCGTGAVAVELATRGAQVLAVDLSATLIEIARERLPSDIGKGHIDFEVGDMAALATGEFDHVLAMDSLIHYDVADGIEVLNSLAPRVSKSMVFTHAPSTLLLEIMHATGKLFPRGDRAPAIQPVSPKKLDRMIQTQEALSAWQRGRVSRVNSGFYISQACELRRQ
ncbi:magnesium protoporphyrin IX methyltransferase [Congregibacter litoralis]|uniref:Magnesium protoporphyrin IX methyltransferase n=1 Tax=Congregibacter litoralis KT71 TaxID=314285 RepID=A4ACP6_9GAMM|nr:magnesium protoporphyrin IX methyltransferase [Congregibacter litoralis]EAQ96260.1 Mg-protoporphyrin IX methyltransferase [Congregibacter litoralis KT71]